MKELYSLLMSTIGLSEREGRVYDDDNEAMLLYKHKYIAMDESYILRNNMMLFDPANNKNLANYLLTVYADKEAEDSGMYVQSFYTMSEIRNPGKDVPSRFKCSVLFADTNIENNIDTKYYYLEGLAYIDAIFCMAGNPIDLSQYDIDEKGALDAIQQRAKKNNK